MNENIGRMEMTLAEHLLSTSPDEPTILTRVAEIETLLMQCSRYVREPDFTEIHPSDLELLFDAYDVRFFAGLCRSALQGRPLGFRLSSRMSKAGGTTTRSTRHATGEVSFEITVASSILFDSFSDDGEIVTVCGLECHSRLQALQRIVEHEMLHLAEYLCWNTSDCSAARFQDIARRLFLHRSHTHQLVTRRELAARAGIRVGSKVSFLVEGRRLSGRVNRITRRATVLVPDPNGQKYSDGSSYKTYYVPLAMLHLPEEKLES